MTYLETLQACGHTALWRSISIAPRVGDKVYCPNCQDMRKVISNPGSWRAQCSHCNWRLSRVHIDGLHTHIHNHVTANPDHEVFLRNYDDSETYIVSAPSPPNPMLQRTGELALFEEE